MTISLVKEAMTLQEDDGEEEAQHLIHPPTSHGRRELRDEDILFADEPVVVVVSSAFTRRRRQLLFLLAAILVFSMSIGLFAVQHQNSFDNKGSNRDEDIEVNEASQDIVVAPNTLNPTTTAPKTTIPTLSPTSISTSPTSIPTLTPTTALTLINQKPIDPVQYYTVARSDRDGAAIKEMLLVHDWAFTNNKTYAGACVNAINWKALAKKHSQHFVQTVKDRIPGRKRLVRVLGLQDALPFACPSKKDLKAGRAKFITRRDFKGAPLSTKWMKYLQSQSNFTYRPAQPDTVDSSTRTPVQVVVHVRRGDITPCHSEDRYLTNAYYLEALDFFLPRYCGSDDQSLCNVTVFSQRQSYESLDAFWDRNYTVDFDSSSDTIWRTIVNADVFVMSLSSFSFVPATLNRGAVITAYGDVEPWVEVPGSVYVKMLHERKRLGEECS